MRSDTPGITLPPAEHVEREAFAAGWDDVTPPFAFARRYRKGNRQMTVTPGKGRRAGEVVGVTAREGADKQTPSGDADVLYIYALAFLGGGPL